MLDKPLQPDRTLRGTKLDMHAVMLVGTPCHHVAMRHMLVGAMTAKNTTTQEPVRPDAALVYRDAASPDRWLVGAPDRSIEDQAFTGPNACVAALEFAHRQYGSARFFSS